MKIRFSENAWADHLYWQSADKAMVRTIKILIRELVRHPHSGRGKPELLKHEMRGYWSRRIDQEHRLVYKVRDEEITILSCRFHFTD